jgi:hypothetical protein
VSVGECGWRGVAGAWEGVSVCVGGGMWACVGAGVDARGWGR